MVLKRLICTVSAGRNEYFFKNGENGVEDLESFSEY